jgi:hypothetical protein
MKTERPSDRPPLTCRGCGASLVVCECCERDDCSAACCYKCMIYDLKEAMHPLHEHGG